MLPSALVLEGNYDASGKVLTMIGMGVGHDGKPAKYRNVTTWTGPDTYVFEMFITGSDGKEVSGLKMTYTRRPAKATPSRRRQGRQEVADRQGALSLHGTARHWKRCPNANSRCNPGAIPRTRATSLHGTSAAASMTSVRGRSPAAVNADAIAARSSAASCKKCSRSGSSSGGCGRPSAARPGARIPGEGNRTPARRVTSASVASATLEAHDSRSRRELDQALHRSVRGIGLRTHLQGHGREEPVLVVGLRKAVAEGPQFRPQLVVRSQHAIADAVLPMALVEAARARGARRASRPPGARRGIEDRCGFVLPLCGG
jgi:hypothetical protein